MEEGSLLQRASAKAWSRPVDELQKILGAFHQMRRRPTSYSWPHIGLQLTGGHSSVINEAQVPILGAASCWRFLTSLPEPLFPPGRLLEPGGTLDVQQLETQKRSCSLSPAGLSSSNVLNVASLSLQSHTSHGTAR